MTISRTNVISISSFIFVLMVLSFSFTISASSEEDKKVSDTQKTDSGLQYIVIEEGTGDKAVS